MNLGYFKNEPVSIDYVKKGKEDYSLIRRIELDFIPDFAQESVIDKSNFIISIRSKGTPIAISNAMPIGDYIVAEKWIYPYFKSKSWFYYPSENNPIGKYLIILSSAKTGSKIDQGIHQWVNSRYESNVFRQGPIDNKGCVRVSKDDIEEVFNSLALGSKIVVR